MTVYNRKMFRKKAGGATGGATGIMASGPELMKRFSVGGVNRFGAGDPRAQITQPGTKFRLNYPSQFSTQIPNTSFIPTGDTGLGSSILTILNPFSRFGDIYQSNVDALEDEKAETKNIIARARSRKGKDVLKNRIAATQGIDVMPAKPAGDVGPFKMGDKQQNVPGIISDTIVGTEQNIKKFTDFITPKINKTLDFFKKMPGDVIDRLEERRKAYEQEKKDKIQAEEFVSVTGGPRVEGEGEEFPEVPKLRPENLLGEASIVGEASHNEKDLSEDKQSTEVVINNTKNKNTKKIDEAKKEGSNATAENHSFSNNFLDANNKNLNTDNLSNVLGVNLEGLSLTDRKALYSNILESTVGDKGSIKSDKDFNLIMTGLLIAAGDSPDALTNITRGLAQGFKMYGDALDDDRKEKRQIQLTATKLAIQAEESAKERMFKKEENRLNRVTTVINKMIDNAGKNNNKFGQTLTTTIAANPKDYMSETEYANFIKSSDQQKVNTIQNKVMGIYNASPFKNQATNFDTQAIIRGVLTGKIPQNIQKETDTKEETKTDTSGIKIKKIN